MKVIVEFESMDEFRKYMDKGSDAPVKPVKSPAKPKAEKPENSKPATPATFSQVRKEIKAFAQRHTPVDARTFLKKYDAANVSDIENKDVAPSDILSDLKTFEEELKSA